MDRQSVISLRSPLITHIRYSLFIGQIERSFCARLHTIKRLIFVRLFAFPLASLFFFSFFLHELEFLTKPSLIKHSIEQAASAAIVRGSGETFKVLFFIRLDS